jgi:hypothetical protein
MSFWIIGTKHLGGQVTTPAGQPSVQPSPKQVTGLMDPGIASTQASAQGGGQYSGSGEPRPKIVGTNMEDVRHASTEGATVGDDQSQLDVTAPQPEQTT